MSLGLWQRPLGRKSTFKIKEREENPCRSIGWIRRRKNMIEEGMDSNLFSTEIVQVKINKINLVRMKPRNKNPWEEEEHHQSNVGGENKITYTRIYLIEEINKRLCKTSKRVQQ